MDAGSEAGMTNLDIIAASREIPDNN